MPLHAGPFRFEWWLRSGGAVLSDKADQGGRGIGG